ncbi:MAG: hypothetical protein KF774_10000 [Planctomyces sp.]|nr:hypothetical protein [Planctomyces sp.]
MDHQFNIALLPRAFQASRPGSAISGRTTYVYDAAGNVRTVEDPLGDVTTSAWDAENQLRGVERPDGTRTTYVWNAARRRVVRETETEEVRYLWSGPDVVRESDAGGVLADYTLTVPRPSAEGSEPQPQPQPFGNLVSQRREGESAFYHFDALGSAQALTDSSQGAL